MWKIVKGSENDFEGAPQSTTVLIGNDYWRVNYWADEFKRGAVFGEAHNFEESAYGYDPNGLDGIYDNGEVYAERVWIEEEQKEKVPNSWFVEGHLTEDVRYVRWAKKNGLSVESVEVTHTIKPKDDSKNHTSTVELVKSKAKKKKQKPPVLKQKKVEITYNNWKSYLLKGVESVSVDGIEKVVTIYYTKSSNNIEHFNCVSIPFSELICIELESPQENYKYYTFEGGELVGRTEIFKRFPVKYKSH